MKTRWIALLVLVLLSVWWFVSWTHVLNVEPVKASLTAPVPSKQRLLFITASYTMEQYLHLWSALSSLLDICNAGWHVEIHLQVANGLHQGHAQFAQLQSSLYCVDSGSEIPIHLTNYSQIGFGLNSQHRSITLQLLGAFDYFVYAEEDMIFTLSHLRAYLAASHRLQHLFPEAYMRYTVGFLRFAPFPLQSFRMPCQLTNKRQIRGQLHFS